MREKETFLTSFPLFFSFAFSSLRCLSREFASQKMTITVGDVEAAIAKAVDKVVEYGKVR